MDITITDSAAERIHEILLEENTDARLRVFVQGGGCSGFSYGFTLEENPTADDDFEIVKDKVTVLVDSMSYQYLAGATIDFKDDIMGAAFSIENPNASTTCGCGSSFAV
jgi:iron-sulfur cluster insertion protein